MASPLTIIGIEVPRTPVGRGQERLSGGEWQIAGVNLLERAVKAAIKETSPDHVRLLTGSPDEGVFRMVEKYGVVETELPAWLQATGDAARSADEEDIVVFLRASVVLKDYACLTKAIEAVRLLGDVDRCEPAMRPMRYDTKLESLHFVDRQESGIKISPWQSLMPKPLEDYGVISPAFEVMKLRTFTLNHVGGMAQSGTAFVWLDEAKCVSLEGPIDWLRAEVMLHSANDGDESD